MRLINGAVVFLLVLSACSGRKAPNGIKLNVIREGTGEFAKPNEYVVVNMVYKDSKDSVWNDSRERKVPIVIPIQDASLEKDEKGIESCFRVLKKGDSVQITVTATSLFVDTWKTQVPPEVKPEEKITFLIGVKDITDNEGFSKLQAEVQQREMEEMIKRQGTRMAEDTLAMDTYLEAQHIKAVRDKSGIRYVISKLGKGPRPNASSTVKINYKGSLMADGYVFDESRQPVEYPLTSLIRGWQIGFPLIPKGSKWTLYVPSSLGYGENGYPPLIPPNANLIFEIELLDFK